MSRRTIAVIIGWVALTAFASVSAQTVWYVNGAVSSSGDGTSWGTAVKTVQEGIDLATPSNLFPDQVWVRRGTYTLSSSILLEAGVEVYGGFVTGTETLLSQRNPDPSGTILSGELGSPGHGDNVEVIVTGATFDSDFVLDGFTITGADNHGVFNLILANGTYRNLIVEENESIYDAFGAGMYVQQSSPNITNCVIRNNQITAGTSGGAGLYTYLSSPIVMDCTFDGNELLGGSPYYPSFGIGGGGGAYVEGGNPLFLSCHFVNNKTINGFGGGLAIESNAATVALCVFADNVVEISNSDNVQGGGGIATHHSTNVIDCSFRRNKVMDNSDDPYGRGGGMWAAKGTSYTNCEFIDNSAGKGGGAAFVNRSGIEHGVEMRNCTFSRNIAGDKGGGIWVNPETSAVSSFIRNVIAWDNAANCDTSCSQDELDQIWFDENDPGVAITYTDIMNFSVSGPFDSGAQQDNLGLDPIFRDPDGANDMLIDDDDDFRLTRCSPVVDRANSSGFPIDTLDLDDDDDTDEPLPDLDPADRAIDLAEFVNLGAGDVEYIDLGAFELEEFACGQCEEPGDMNGDTERDGADIQPFVDCFLAGRANQGCGCECGDYVFPVGVGIEDVAEFVN